MRDAHVGSKRSWRDRDERDHKRPDSARQSSSRHASDANSCQRFRVLRPSDLERQEQRATLSKPTEIGYFSKDADETVRFDRSSLRRYKAPRVGANLLDGIDQYVSKDEAQPDAHPAPLAPLLAALAHFQGRATHTGDKRPHFVTFRNNLNKIMGTPYNTSSEWTMLAEKRGGCVYLDVRRTEQDKAASRTPMSENQRRGAFAGRQFEVLATHRTSSSASTNSSDASNGVATQTVNEGEEFCGLFATTLGGKRLVLGAEIDCFDGHEARAERYVELKTFRVLATEKDTFVFERFKLLAFWIQSFVVGTPTIVCGFRSDAFDIVKLQSFATTDLPAFGRKYWRPSVCLNFASSLLDWVYAETQEGRVYEVTYAPRAHVVEMVELHGASFVSSCGGVQDGADACASS